jgi:hypothetical protein
MVGGTMNRIVAFNTVSRNLARRCLHHQSQTTETQIRAKKTIIRIRPAPSPINLPPPEVLDSEHRDVLGTVMLPSILKTRMQNLLRKESGKSRVGIEKFIAKHQYEFEKNLQGRRDFPFTRGK